MKICAYVQEKYAKQTYKNECMDTRQFVGLRMIMESLRLAGYDVEFAGIATVHKYDVVLVSITSDCDWWEFIRERVKWRPGSYKVIVGGAGVLHVAPFLPFADFFSLGRGENTVVRLVDCLAGKTGEMGESIIESSRFSPDKKYSIQQEGLCRFPVPIAGGEFTEKAMGCNHKCFFCGYTWQRKHIGDEYAMDNSIVSNFAGKERAMLDIAAGIPVDFSTLRTTAIDGMSERLRVMVNKPITNDMIIDFIRKCKASDAKPHQIKLFNIVGYPTETTDDWEEYVDVLRMADGEIKQEKQWCFLLNCTPFRPTPATPLACAPASLRNYRGEIGKTLGKGLKGNIIFQGNDIWSVEGMGTDSLATVMLSMIAIRAEQSDTENIIRLCSTPKFWAANSATKEATLSKYFDVERLFGEYTPETLPSRYLKTYAKIEKLWNRPPWKEAFSKKPLTCDVRRVER